MSKSVTHSFVLPDKAERLRLFGSVDPIQGDKPVNPMQVVAFILY
ncbi:hypothetical protein ABEW32_06565 [Paenibacillus jamilae]